MSNINKIKLSGQTYSIEDENATKTVELTQAQYDALTVKDPNTFYVITDAQGADLSNYYTKSETSGATQISTALASKQTTLTAGTNITIVDNVISATGGGGGSSYQAGDGIDITNDVISVTGKVDTSTYNTYTAATDTALASKQDQLVSGTNIKTINNESILGSGNITIEGGGGGSSYTAGTNISIDNDTINCTLPIKKIQGRESVIIGDSRNTVDGNANVAVGYGNSIYPKGSSYIPDHCFVSGQYNNVYNSDETAFGLYNNSVQNTLVGGESGTTLFSVGNGTSNSARHNAFEIRRNGDIYLTKDGQDVKLQDQLGGTVDTEITSASTNPVTSAAIYNQLGGLKLVKLSQSAYDSLSTKDSNTLYIIEETPQCNIPSTATWHNVDNTFDKITQIYGVDFGSGDGGNDGTGRDYSLEVRNQSNTIYGITCHLKDRNSEMGDSDSIVISNSDGTTYRQLDDTSIIQSFCEVFGEPMYISANATIPSYEQCVDEQCTEYECIQYDEETGECIEQGAGCISSECMQYQTTYFINVLY